MLEEAVLTDGGWFISRNSRRSPIEESEGVYLTITTKRVDRLHALYDRLAEAKLGLYLFALEKRTDFCLQDYSRTDLKDLTPSDIFDFYRFSGGDFKKADATEFFDLFEKIDKNSIKWREENWKAPVYNDTSQELRRLVENIKLYDADHEAKFLDRLFIDRFFIPLYRKGNISDIDFILDLNDHLSVIDIKSKDPYGKPPKYGINDYKIEFFSEIDEWPGFTSLYVVNERPKGEISREHWLSTPMKNFKSPRSPVIDGGAGRTNGEKVDTFPVRVSEFDYLFFCKE